MIKINKRPAASTIQCNRCGKKEFTSGTSTADVISKYRRIGWMISDSGELCYCGECMKEYGG